MLKYDSNLNVNRWRLNGRFTKPPESRKGVKADDYSNYIQYRDKFDLLKDRHKITPQTDLGKKVRDSTKELSRRGTVDISNIRKKEKFKGQLLDKSRTRLRYRIVIVRYGLNKDGSVNKSDYFPVVIAGVVAVDGLHSLPFMLRRNLPNKGYNSIEYVRDQLAEIETAKIDGFSRWYIDTDELYYIQYNQPYQKIMGLERAIIKHERHRATDVFARYV